MVGILHSQRGNNFSYNLFYLCERTIYTKKFGGFKEKHYICTVKKNRIHITANERRGAYKEASHFALDMAKLIFGGVILAGIMDLDVDKWVLFLVGGLIVLIMILLGTFLYFMAIKD